MKILALYKNAKEKPRRKGQVHTCLAKMKEAGYWNFKSMSREKARVYLQI